MSSQDSTLLTDDEISDFLRYTVKNLREASELLLNENGQPRRANFISSAHFIFQELTNELEIYAEKVRLNGNVYKTRRDYLRMLKLEQEYKEDEKYFARLRRERAELETQQESEETSNAFECK